MAITTYHFPPGSKDPFDPSFAGNYFVFAELHSNLAYGLEELKSKALEKYVPIGRTTIIFCYRTALITRGAVRQEWAFTDHHNLKGDYYAGKYLVTSDQPVNGDASWSLVTDSLYTAIEQALELSTQHDNQFLVSIILDSLMWH